MTTPATPERLAAWAPLPHQFALEVATRHAPELARNYALFGGPPTMERHELWRAIFAPRAGLVLSEAESELLGFTAPLDGIEFGWAPGSGPAAVPVALLRGAARAGLLGHDSVALRRLCDTALDPARVADLPAEQLGELAASPLLHRSARARLITRAPVAWRVGLVLQGTRLHDSETSASVVWSVGAPRPGSGDDFLALAALAHLHRELAAVVASAVTEDRTLGSVDLVATLVALGVWESAPKFTSQLVAAASALASAGAALGVAGRGASVQMLMIAARATGRGRWAPPPAVRVELERWLGAHPSKLWLDQRAAAESDRWASLGDGRLAAWSAGERDAAVPTFGFRWDPDAAEGRPLEFAEPPRGFVERAADALGDSPAAWRFAFEIADGSLSVEEVFAMASAVR